MLGMLRALDRRARGAVAGVLIVLALAGCGSPSAEISHALSAPAHASRAVTRLSHRLMRSWCPEAVAQSGRELTPAQAHGCLQRAWSDWLRELRRNGYDPYAGRTIAVSIRARLTSGARSGRFLDELHQLARGHHSEELMAGAAQRERDRLRRCAQLVGELLS